MKPESLNKCFVRWVESLIPNKSKNFTVALDGKTIRSTTKKDGYKSPLHIVSAYISELGMTFAQKSVNDKSNEIPAVQELLNELNIKGCMIVADALNCQKETAKIVVKGNGDYLLCVKDNQASLKKDIEDYVQEESIRKEMDTVSKIEKKQRKKRKTNSIYNK